MTLLTSRRSLLRNSAAAVAAIGLGGRLVRAQDAPIRIGVIYDLSGPFAAAGSVPCAIGAQIAIDIVNERGGVAGKYKVQPINADSQSKADAAINEVERLINQEKVEIVLGVYASAHAVPLAARSRHKRRFCGSPRRLRPRCSRTKIGNTCSVRRYTLISTVRHSPRFWRKTPKRSSVSNQRT
jgi:ABC-type branched-subunit amino acid transport system substrate-binding protein